MNRLCTVHKKTGGMGKGGTENEEEGTGKGQDDATVRDKYRTEIPRKQRGMCTGRWKVYYEGPKL